MAKRVQSPSSIKTFKQCPRKYYYQYIEKLPTKGSIHTVRGTIAHSVLEDFFETDVTAIPVEAFDQTLRITVQKLFITHWKGSAKELAELALSKDDEIKYFEETLMMLFNWLEQFLVKLRNLDEPLTDAFKHLTPARELEYKSDELWVRGFVDAIETVNGLVRIMDYKTSKESNLDEHTLQLAIYSLLYFEKHNRLPDYVGVYFLRTNEQTMRADMKLVEMAKKEILEVHQKTVSVEKGAYPMRITKLCNWGAGQCDFYGMCFKKQPPEDLVRLDVRTSPETVFKSDDNP